jgi:CSLREA domain-containing protein
MNATMTARKGFPVLPLIPWMLAMVVALAIGAAAESATASTFTVTSAADSEGSCPTSIKQLIVKLPCTLRTAIEEVNAHPTTSSAPHVINFDIGFGQQRIALGQELPHVTQPVVIDGTTQMALKFVGGTSMKLTCLSVLHHPCIELYGGGMSKDGLTLVGGNATIRGLMIDSFTGSGISIQSSNNTVEGNYIGTDGSSQCAPTHRLKHGVILAIPAGSAGSAANNVIKANVISGNSQNGVLLDGVATHDNLIVANYIGTTADGSLACGNGAGAPDSNMTEPRGGVVIRSGARNNTIGGIAQTSRNVISGNGTVTSDSGVVIVDPYGLGTIGNQVLGNYIGIDIGAAKPIGNFYAGVLIKTASGNAVGAGGLGNLIGGNPYGVSVEGNSYSNTLQANSVGTSVGTLLANIHTGINLQGPASGNLITANTSTGNPFDMSDSNPTCSNSWIANIFGTDNESFPNNGPGVGCIQ